MRELDGMSDADLRKVRDVRARQREPQDRARRGRAQARERGLAPLDSGVNLDGVGTVGSGYPGGWPPASTRPARGAELELTVDTLAHGGNGVARLDGYVVFVAGALPGDRVRAVVGKSKRAYAEARAVEILEPSPDRIAPVADHPGAPWQVLAYERQLEVKAEQVGDALRRIGRLEGFEQDPIVPAVEQWRYRNKLEYSFGTGPDGALVCGFHAPGRFDEIVALDDCLLASERGNAAREQVLAWCARAGAAGLGPARPARPAAQPRRARGPPHRRAPGPPRHLARRDRRDALAAAVDCEGLFWTQAAGARREHAGRRDEALAGSKRLREQLGDLEFLISPEAFFQTNTEMAEVLYGDARRARRPARARARLRPLLRHRHDRRSRSPAARARSSASRSSSRRSPTRSTTPAATRSPTPASSPATSASPCASWSSRPASRTSRVIDPPRAGLSQKVVRRIVEAAPKRIVYVSCNPTTLAPNAAQLVEAGYELKRVRPVDMFPQTPHIECVALLEAGPAACANPERD